MTRTKVKRLTALGGAAALCFGVAAQAGTQQEIFTESFTVANIGSFRNIDVPQFDPQGGCRELLKVTLEAEGVGTGDYAFTNDSDTLCTGSVTINYGATVTFPFPSGPPPILECSQFDSVGPIPILLNPDETLDLPDLIDFQFSCMDMTDPGEDLSPFIGMGTIVARYDGDQDTDTEIDCDFTESLDTDFTGTITITYEYQPNPPQCDIKGLTSLCPATQDELYTVNIDAGDQPVDIVWSIVGDAEFCVDPAGGETALVCTDPVCGGSFTLTVTVTNPLNPDECFGECSLTVLLEDDEPPIITCPPDVTITCKDDSSPTGTGQATADDNCAPPNPVTIDFSDVESGNCPVIITRTWTATDFCDNTASCDQIITVTDLIPPVLNLPPDATITCKDDSSPSGTGSATATDNCDPGVPVVGFSDVVLGNCPVTLERTWTATDKCGNTASGVQIILINDDFPPVLTVPPDVKITCKDSTDPADTGQASADDNCSPAGIQIGFTDNLFGNCPVTLERTWTATDKCGNTASGVQVILINDDFPPVLTVPPDVKITCKDSTDPADTGQASADDNCSPAGIQIGFTDNLFGNCPVTLERTWTATDKCGNTASGVQVILINDDFPPVLTVPPDVKITCKDSTDPADTGQASADDNCSPAGIQIGFTDDVFGNCPVTLERTWTATDKCGNTASGVQIILINDDFPPVLTVPPDVKITCKDSTDPADTGQASADDNCSPAGIQIGFTDNLFGNCPVTLERTWTATDKCGNTASGVQVILINDDFPPVLTVPPDVKITCKDSTDPADTGQASADDNCSPAGIQIGFTDDVFGNCPVTLERTWTATDKCGNTASGVQVILINDDFPPVLTVPPDVKITCKDSTDPADTGQASADDNCSPAGIQIGFTDDVFGNCPVTLERTWTATDKCGNTASGVQIILINDDFPPVLTVPPDVKITCKDSTDPADTGQASADDNCSPAGIQIGFTDNLFGNCPVTLERTWTATDKCGNTASGVQVILINDDFPPVLTVPPDVKITCKDSTDPADTGQASADDNCDPGDPVVTFTEVMSGNCPVIITRTWCATDKCGNTACADQIITVNDDLPPVLTLPPDVKISCKDDSSPAATGEATATDNCDPGAPVVTFTDVVTGNCPVIITRTWTATDKCGNTAAADQIITVNDDIPPVLTVPPDIKITCKDDTGPANTGKATADENCGPVVINFRDVLSGNCPVIIERNWFAIDKCGNETTGVQIILLNDEFPPVLTLPPDVKINCKEDATPNGTGRPTVEDNCSPDGIQIAFSDEVSGNCPVIIERTWTATDKCGNTAIGGVQIITINDDIPPVLTPPPDIKITCKDDSSPAGTGKATAQDNCSPIGVEIQFSDVVSGNCPVIIERTWTATDRCGNTASADQVITVNDDIPPVLSGVPGDITVECDSVPLPADVTAEDNCGGATVDFAQMSEGNCPIIITRIWTAIDKCGNTTFDSQTITAVDTTPPLITCPEDIAAQVDKFVDCAANVDPGTPDVIDNCDQVPSVEGVRSDGQSLDAPYPLGETTIVWTATDKCGNYADCEQIITVVGSGNDCNNNEIPDECEEDCNDNGIPDTCDIGNGTSQDCNGNGIPDECDIEDGACDDLDDNGVCDECEVDECTGGGTNKPRLLVLRYTGDDCSGSDNSQDPGSVTCTDFDGSGPLPDTVFLFVTDKPVPGAGNEKIWFQGDVSVGDSFVPDAANAGENTLGGETCVHVFDVEGGTLLQTTCFHTSCSQPLVPGDQFGTSLLLGVVLENDVFEDCNGNGVDDALEIELGKSLDCNGNGVPDQCDIADGTSADDNDNDVPDECECPCDCATPPNGEVDAVDFLALLAQWGGPGTCDCEDPPDGTVDAGDFLALLAAWGACP